MKTYLTAKEAASRLGCGLRTIREACARGDIPCVRNRTAYLIAQEDVDAYGRYRKAHALRKPGENSLQRQGRSQRE